MHVPYCRLMGAWCCCCGRDDPGRTLFETLVVQIRPKELVLEKNGVSDATRRIVRNLLANPIVNWACLSHWLALASQARVHGGFCSILRQLVPQVQFWDAQATVDQLQFGNYFGMSSFVASRGRMNAQLAPRISNAQAKKAARIQEVCAY